MIILWRELIKFIQFCVYTIWRRSKKAHFRPSNVFCRNRNQNGWSSRFGLSIQRLSLDLIIVKSTIVKNCTTPYACQTWRKKRFTLLVNKFYASLFSRIVGTTSNPMYTIIPKMTRLRRFVISILNTPLLSAIYILPFLSKF